MAATRGPASDEKLVSINPILVADRMRQGIPGLREHPDGVFVAVVLLLVTREGHIDRLGAKHAGIHTVGHVHMVKGGGFPAQVGMGDVIHPDMGRTFPQVFDQRPLVGLEGAAPENAVHGKARFHEGQGQFVGTAVDGAADGVGFAAQGAR